MKAHFHGEFVCMWSLHEHTFNMRSFNLVDLAVYGTQGCQWSHNMYSVISSAIASIYACNYCTVCGMVK